MIWALIIKNWPFLVRLSVSLSSVPLMLYYASLLGPERRSIMVFLFVLSALFMQLVVLPAAHEYRRQTGGKSFLYRFHADYFHKILFLILASIPIYNLILLAFSFIVAPIPSNLFLVSLLYWVISHFGFALQEYLQVLQRFKLDALVSFLGLLAQAFSIYLFLSFSSFSIFTSILLSLCAGSCLRILITLIVFFTNDDYQEFRKDNEFFNFKEIIYSTTARANFLDTYIRLVVGFTLPLGTLAKCTLVIALLFPLRTILDISIRYRISNRIKIFTSSKGKRNTLILVSIAILSFPISHLLNCLLLRILGAEWLLPIQIVMALIIFEMYRLASMLVENLRITNQENLQPSKDYGFFLAAILFPALFAIVGINGLMVLPFVAFFLFWGTLTKHAT